MIGTSLVVLSCFISSVAIAMLVFSNIDVRWWLREHRDYIKARDVRWEARDARREKQAEADHQEILRAIRGDRPS